MSLLFHLQFNRPKFLEFALLSGMLLHDSPTPQDATEIPAMRAFDCDLHNKPKFALAAH
jgi:hypothetical protein